MPIPISPKSRSNLGLPLFVKPAREGSSIGVTKVKERGALKAAYEEAAALRQWVGPHAALRRSCLGTIGTSGACWTTGVRRPDATAEMGKPSVR